MHPRFALPVGEESPLPEHRTVIAHEGTVCECESLLGMSERSDRILIRQRNVNRTCCTGISRQLLQQRFPVFLSGVLDTFGFFLYCYLSSYTTPFRGWPEI